MINRTKCCIGIVMPLLLIGLFIGGGCEEADQSVEGNLTISPNDVDLVGETNTILLTAISTNDALDETIIFPLEWSVANTNVGIILSHAGWEAIYVHAQVEIGNLVTVRDGYGREGFALISWHPAESNLVDEAEEE